MFLTWTILLISGLFWPLGLPSFFAYVFSPKLLLTPAIFFLLLFLSGRSKIYLLGFFFATLILFFYFPFGQTIFRIDYERHQVLIRNIHLYPNIFLARVYQNKGQIILSKLADNFTQLLDPNNYFFANHPRELRNNPNLPKFPYPVIVFFLVGLFSYNWKLRSPIFLFLLSCITNLSLLTNHFGHDFVLWPIILYFIYLGQTIIGKLKYGKVILSVALILTIIEL